MQGPLRGQSPQARPALRVTSEQACPAHSADREPTRWSREREASPSLQRAVLLATRRIAGQASESGESRGRVEGDAGNEARLLLTLLALGLTDGDRADRLADQLIASQLPTGGWSATPGNAANVSTSLIAYLAVKLLRGPNALPELSASRRAIVALGGLRAADDEANAWLALFGQAELLGQAEPRLAADDKPWKDALTAGGPPGFNALHGVRELNVEKTTNLPAADRQDCTYLAQLCWRRLGLEPAGDADEIARIEQAIEALIDDGDNQSVRVSPHADPDSDTALALQALVAAGRHDEAGHAASWLAGRADTLCQLGDLMPAALALLALAGWSNAPAASNGALPPRLRVIGDDSPGGDANSNNDKTAAAVDKAVALLSARLTKQQQPDGGWGADDVTAIVVEALALTGNKQNKQTAPAIAAGVDCLIGRQQPDGAWRSSQATDDVFATSRAVIAIAAAQQEEPSEALLAGANWLLATQSRSGGWGEQISPTGETLQAAAATTTAWALEALTAADQQHSDACGRAVGFLLQTQHDTGEWREPHFVLRSTVGNACRNDLRPTLASATALAAWASRSRQNPAAEEEVGLRVVRQDTAAS